MTYGFVPGLLFSSSVSELNASVLYKIAETRLLGPVNINGIAAAGTIFFSSKAEGVPCSHST